MRQVPAFASRSRSVRCALLATAVGSVAVVAPGLVDANFGVAAPIVLQEITAGGQVVARLKVTTRRPACRGGRRPTGCATSRAASTPAAR